MNEINLVKPEVVFTPSTIRYNFEDLDNKIKGVKIVIDSLELIEKNIAEVKQYNTKLNELATSLNEDKKKIKKNVAPGLKEFEDECMKRVNRLKEVGEITKDFINDVERIRKENKKAEIKEFFNSLENTYGVPYELCMRDEFLLKTCKSKKWKEDINLNKELLEKEFERLNDINVDDLELLKKLFKDTWDYGTARNEYDRIKTVIAPQKEIVEEVIETVAEELIEDVESIAFVNAMVCISGTKSNYDKALSFMKSLGLEVEVI